MGLIGLTLLKNATSASATGGTSVTFQPVGVEVKSGVNVADVAETDQTVRTHVTFTNRPARQLGDGTFSKSKRTFTVITPIALADGSITPGVFRGELEIHPKLTQAQVDNLRLLACQCLCDADVLSFLNTGNLS